MEKVTGAEKERLRSLGREYLYEWKAEREKALQKLSPELQEFIKDCTRSRNLPAKSALAADLKSGLADGRYKKPSDFFRYKAMALFNGVIYPGRQKAFLYAVDHVHELAYSTSMWRRSFRSKAPEAVSERILQIVYDYYEKDHFDIDICDILEEKNLSEKQLGHLHYSYFSMYGLESAVAAEIDFGNERLINIIKDTLCGDSEVSMRLALGGAMQSHNKELHELVGKLLLAAQLQEGLRQAICQEMDCAVPEVFSLLLDIIIQNNLIRFSSVKRAVGTWLGLINIETDKVERISDKSVELIADCINDPSVREEYLASEDSMKIYIALWSYGFYEAEDMLKKIQEISVSGTHHQILTAGYAAENLDNKFFMHRIANSVIKQHKNSPDILAMYMPCFMSDVLPRMDIAINGELDKDKDKKYTVKRYCDWSYYFESPEETEETYNILMEILEGIKGKRMEYSPCVFPWHSAVLSRSDIMLRLAFIASALQDNDKIDQIVSRISEVDADYRSRPRVIKLLLPNPETEIQRKALTEAVCDKETSSRRAAFEIIQETEITPGNYLRLEEMLKYKNSDMRSNVIKLLLKQNDEALFGTVSRLISDKKEEKRTAALDIIINLDGDENKTELFNKCRELVSVTEKTSDAEKILIDRIIGNPSENTETVDSLYSENASYTPVFNNDFMKKAEKVFKEYFGKPQDCKKIILKLSALIHEHRDDEFVLAYSGETTTLGGGSSYFMTYENGSYTIPFHELWDEFYEKEIGSPKMLYLCCLTLLTKDHELSSFSPQNAKSYDDFFKKREKIISDIVGKSIFEETGWDYFNRVLSIFEHLFKKYADKNEMMYVSAAFAKKLIDKLPGLFLDFGDEKRTILNYYPVKLLLSGLRFGNADDLRALFPIRYALEQMEGHVIVASYGKSFQYYFSEYSELGVGDYIRAAFYGVITEEFMYKYFFEAKTKTRYSDDVLNHAVSMISNIYAEAEEADSPVSVRGRRYRGRNETVYFLRKQNEADYTDEDRQLIEYVKNIYRKLTGVILSAELKRGDSDTPYSKASLKMQRIYGVDNFVSILLAMGSITLERSTYIPYNPSSVSKKLSLSHLLSVCVPEPSDSAEKLKQRLSGTGITEKRLIEAALYSPEWIDIVGEYLGWEGFTSACYYFMAHMNERFDDKRKAVIARYTPLDEEELNSGAFDIDWFRSAYDTVGEKRFNMIYDAAKYISDGAKHSRARKYADAVQGKFVPSEIVKTIADKRNKDLLMAYALIPLADDDDLSERYLYLQQFLKESKRFGSQRSASEKKAVETAMRNLALNAGYSDTARLTLRMETKLIDDSRELFEDKQIEDVIVKLVTDEKGKTEILCNKNGKALKSVPAKLKKNEYIVRLSETKKALTEQYRRTKAMFEQAMEDSTEFTAGEINILRKNPVILPVINDMIFTFGGKIGFFADGKLTDYAGKVTKLTDSDKLSAAHTFLIYKDGHWQDYQKLLFDKGTVQPFKQVFRELYIKTDEEREMNHSLRYAGNQIQPAKTVACLKSRRWVADVEDGLQKVYYKENIVARIYAIADWFTPADIEAPTLEWVEFSDRKTGKEIKIGDVPDVIFSEVMRDVDLAVSVAHAGGVDPEASHSTMEMRAALMEFTLPLFKLGNVQIKEHHAHIEGKYGDYTVHLGSGVIHKKGGAMIAVLPVHSQHRGKLFLPFADDDPKTAEIITKVLFLAEDSKIKDPTILEQIKA